MSNIINFPSRVTEERNRREHNRRVMRRTDTYTNNQEAVDNILEFDDYKTLKARVKQIKSTLNNINALISNMKGVTK